MEHCSGIAEVVGSNPLQAWIFFQALSSLLLKQCSFLGRLLPYSFCTTATLYLEDYCNIQVFLFRLEIVENDEGKNILEHPDYFEVHKLFTLKDLFNANVHLGHNEGCWDPLMKPYLFGVREKHHIIDLNQTVVHLRVCKCIMRIKGLSFQRNCGAAWVGEYNRVIKYYQLSWLHKVASKQSSKANVSSIHHCSDEGLMLEMSAMLSFTGANFCY